MKKSLETAEGAAAKAAGQDGRLAKLRKYTSDEEIIKDIDHVVFNQDELAELLEKEAGIEKIYLCGEEFAIPLDYEALFIGVNNPKVFVLDDIDIPEDEATAYVGEGDIGYLQFVTATTIANVVDPVSMWRPAADQGNSVAQNEMGNVCYEKADYDGAFGWYKKAADQDNPRAKCNLAMLYCEGEGVEENYEEAIKYYKSAAAQDDTWAEYFLGETYFNGTIVDVDYEEASRWYERAAAKGYADAEYMIGLMYFEGRGVEKDDAKAFDYFMAAAKQNEGLAQYWVGYFYAKGIVVDEDKEAAFEWYLKAAKQGDEDAQREIANMYKEGVGE